ncbi:MAG: L-aspartate oxidase [Gemmatimonadota bacterium]
MTQVETDILVIGSGIAGLTLALKVAEVADVVIVTKKDRVDSNTNYAQGGVAAAVGPGDSPELHVRDTLVAGAGLCHRRAVEELAREGPERVQELMEWGVRFTRETGGERLSLGREAGHRRRRILHAADLTGQEIERALLEAVERRASIRLLDDHFVWSLHTELHPATLRSRCSGARVLDVRSGAWIDVRARAVFLSTGGCGRLYRHTTNPEIATGDGIALGFRAGAAAANLEFMQFHPTALFPAGSRAFLISEAVRGEGAVLRRQDGTAFMDKHHPAGSLAPRDVVARAIHSELAASGEEYVVLDLAPVDAGTFDRRFPTIARACRERGIDVPKDPIPVIPAAHYTCGGLLTDWDGRTSLAGLFAAGEVACTGVHGANRLASNSLLEAVVFAHRAAARLLTDLPELPPPTGSPTRPPARGSESRHAAKEESGHGGRPGRAGEGMYHAAGVPRRDAGSVLDEVRNLMWECVGMVRTDEGLAQARSQLDALAGFRAIESPGAEGMAARETEFALLVASLIVRCAQRRLESRGLHYTTSHPYRDNERFLRDTVLAR